MSRAVAVVAVVLSGWLAASGCRPVSRAHVLLIVIDAWRADHLGASGAPWPITPNLDTLAEEGVLFERAYSTSTWTKPAMASLFTGRYPGGHGLRLVATEEGERLLVQTIPDGLPMLAESFARAGYATGAVVNQVHLTRQAGFGRGFAAYVHQRGKAAPWMVDRLLRWFDEAPERPYFVWLHLLDPHWPYQRTVGAETVVPGPVALGGDVPRPCLRRPARPDRDCHQEFADWLQGAGGEEALAALRRRYAREVEYVDRELGRLFSELRRRGLWEETIVIVTSDHGEGFFEHGRLQHGYSPYDELLRVPLLIRLPERLRGEEHRSARPVSLVDLFPTLLRLARLEPVDGLDGRALWPPPGGDSEQRRILFAEAPSAEAALLGRHKLIRFADGHTEFFDLDLDPAERRPLDGCPPECGRLEQSLRDQRAAWIEQPEADVPLSDAERRQLEALGYL